MIQVQTYLNIIDNTGAKQIMCLKILGTNKKYASIGDIIVGVVKKAIPNMSIKQAQIVRAIIVRTKRLINRKDGSCLRFNENAAVIINTDNNLKGTRVFGPIAYELKEKKFIKLISLASEII